MSALKHGGLLLATASLATLAACATTHGALTSSANRMAHDADVLALNTRADSAEYGTRDYSRDGRSVAAQADALRRSVQDRPVDARNVTDALDRLARSYDTLREDANRSGNPNALAELNPVTRDYLGIESEAELSLALQQYAQSRNGSGRS